jgi:alpha-glucosidase
MKKTEKRRFYAVRKIIVLCLSGFCLYSCSAGENEYSISSPDEKTSISVWMSDDKGAFYKIKFCDTVVLQQSKLGLVREDGDFSKELSLKSASDIETVRFDYEMLQGKRRRCSYAGNRQTFHFTNCSGKKMDIIFQVSNDGVAFRYYFPEQSQNVKKITKETTSFNFPSGTKAWIQPMTKAKTLDTNK